MWNVISAREEADLIRSLGLEYRPIPVDFEAPEAEDRERVMEVMGQFRGKRVFVHCPANMRVSSSCPGTARSGLVGPSSGLGSWSAGLRSRWGLGAVHAAGRRSPDDEQRTREVRRVVTRQRGGCVCHDTRLRELAGAR